MIRIIRTVVDGSIILLKITIKISKKDREIDVIKNSLSNFKILNIAVKDNSSGLININGFKFKFIGSKMLDGSLDTADKKEKSVYNTTFSGLKIKSDGKFSGYVYINCIGI